MSQDEDKLIDEIRNSIVDMKAQMEETYSALSSTVLSGQSHDGSVVIKMKATNELVDIDMQEAALQGGVKELKYRLMEAWKETIKQTQEATQNQTWELLQGVEVPEDIRDMKLEDASDQDEEG